MNRLSTMNLRDFEYSVQSLIRTAKERSHQSGSFAAHNVHPYQLATVEISQFFSQLLPAKDWSILGEDAGVYNQDKFCYKSDTELFADVFRLVFQLQGRVNVTQFIKNCVAPWTTSPIFEAFVLSKTKHNMTYHVDGGTSVGSDLVLYLILSSVSCFLLTSIDPVALQSAKNNDEDFPSTTRIENSLAQPASLTKTEPGTYLNQVHFDNPHARLDSKYVPPSLPIDY